MEATCKAMVADDIMCFEYCSTPTEPNAEEGPIQSLDLFAGSFDTDLDGGDTLDLDGLDFENH